MAVFHVGNGPLSRLDAIEKIPDVRVKQRVRRALDASRCPELRAAARTPLGTAGRVSPEHRDLVFRRPLFIREHLVTAARERHAALRAEELEAFALAPSQARLADRADHREARILEQRVLGVGRLAVILESKTAAAR